MKYSFKVTDLAITMLSGAIDHNHKLHSEMHLAVVRKIEEELMDCKYKPEDAAALIAQECLDQLINHIKAL